MFCLRSVSRQSFHTSRRGGVVAHGRRFAAALFLGSLGFAGLTGGDLGLEIFAGGPLVEGLSSAGVIAVGALLLDVLVPVRRPCLVGERADAADVAVGAVFDVDDLRLVQVVGHFVPVLPGDHGDGLAAEDVGQTIVPVDDVAVGRGVLARIDVPEVLVALRDHGGRPVEGRVLVAIDGFPLLALVDAEAPDEEPIGPQRRAHEMGLQLEATVHLAGAAVHRGEILEGQRAALRRSGRVGRATRGGAGSSGAGGGGQCGGNGRERDGGSRNATAADVAAAVAGVEPGLAFAAAEGEGRGEDESDAEGLDVHEFRAPGGLGLLSSSSPEGASRLVLTSVPPLARRTCGHFGWGVVECSRDLKSCLVNRPVQGRKSAPFVFGHDGLLSRAVCLRVIDKTKRITACVTG